MTCSFLHQLKSFYISLVLFILTSSSLAAQESKSLKESLADLKKSFKPDKAFFIPTADTSNPDIQAFVSEVRKVKGVEGTSFTIRDNGTYILLNTKNSMTNVWNNLPGEIHDRYQVTERTEKGFKLLDKMPASTARSTQVNNQNQQAGKSVTENTNETFYDKVEKEANEDYKTDTTARKSVWQQQKDHAEKMRQRNRDREIGRSDYANDTIKYKSLKPVLGFHFFEYKINGKVYSINSKSNHPISAYAARSASYNGLLLTFSDARTNLYFTVDMSDPAKFVNTRKFLFGSEKDEDGNSELQMHVPNFVFTLKYPMKTVLANAPTGFGSPVLYACDKPGATWGSMTPNVISGYIEIYHYIPGGGGTIEGRFQLKVKESEVVTKGKTAKIPPFTITEGKFRTQIRY